MLLVKTSHIVKAKDNGAENYVPPTEEKPWQRPGKEEELEANNTIYHT